MKFIWTRVALALILFAGLASQASAVAWQRTTVAATATLIWTAPTASVGRVLVRNPAATTSVYVGGATVTTSNGFEVPAGAALAINLFDGDQLYGIVATGTQVVEWIQGSNPGNP